MTSVGRGSNLLLNIPPDRRGLIHENDVKSLIDWRKMLDEKFGKNLAVGAMVNVSSSFNKNLKSQNLLDGNSKTFWASTLKDKNATIVIDLKKTQTINFIEIQEYIALGQRVKSFTIEVWKDDNWKEIASETTIGYKRILRIDPINSQKIRMKIIETKGEAVLSEIKVWQKRATRKIKSSGYKC